MGKLAPSSGIHQQANLNKTSNSPQVQSSGGQLAAGSTGLQQQQHSTMPVLGAMTPNGYKCDYCPKSFSNRSNKNRHMLLSCEVAGPNARNARGESTGSAATTPKTTSKSSNGGFRDSLKRLNS